MGITCLMTYSPSMSASEEAWLQAWTDDVRRSIRAGEETYLRDPSHDALLSLLFPEMAERLASSGGKRKY